MGSAKRWSPGLAVTPESLSDFPLAGNLLGGHQHLKPDMRRIAAHHCARAQVSLPAEFTISAKKKKKKNPSFSNYPRAQVTFVPTLSLTQAPISRVAPEPSSLLTGLSLDLVGPLPSGYTALRHPHYQQGILPDASQMPSLASNLSRIFLAFPLSLCSSASSVTLPLAFVSAWNS